MKYLSASFCITFFCFVLLTVSAQKNRQLSIAFVNTASAYPFAKFGSLVTNLQHPGIEIGYNFNWKTRDKHDWYQEIKTGYFYHRFVQHAIPLYTDFGYRYKFKKKWTAQVALGAGYLHSLPAAGQFELNENGTYKKKKSIGRIQAMAVANLGIAYTITGKLPVKVFSTYQQQIQMPFVKSYVPILPYNSLIVGVSIPCKF